MPSTSKPSLPYIEYHVVRHCNLNCKGCANFSNISQESYSDPIFFQRDLLELSTLFSNIKTINLTGGESLLHPNLLSFISISRKIFPKSNIYVSTNGLLLHTLLPSFWSFCKKNRIYFIWSQYPMSSKVLSNISFLFKSKGVQVWSQFYERFEDRSFNPNLNVSPTTSFTKCRNKQRVCTTLRDGSLYLCPRHAYTDVFNTYYTTSIPVLDGFKVSTFLDSSVLLSKLNTPIELCGYCDMSPDTFPWQAGKRLS